MLRESRKRFPRPDPEKHFGYRIILLKAGKSCQTEEETNEAKDPVASKEALMRVAQAEALEATKNASSCEEFLPSKFTELEVVKQLDTRKTEKVIPSAETSSTTKSTSASNYGELETSSSCQEFLQSKFTDLEVMKQFLVNLFDIN
ncbi:hypothetical protein OUZ56_029547 [Daphnia magna]|uniref:Uncharacterized protein n=1 Tax=Daphnia magna TaxID=35525 RepID=A0ABR0B754_9CRUS|nr:hypothetical protein OUZ56_029547 [Daphnia magna]